MSEFMCGTYPSSNCKKIGPWTYRHLVRVPGHFLLVRVPGHSLLVRGSLLVRVPGHSLLVGVPGHSLLGSDTGQYPGVQVGRSSQGIQ